MEIVIPYKPREQQLDIHTNKKRWNILLCHRRFGKTVFAINDLIKEALTHTLNNPRFAYIAPFLSQAKAIAWDYLKYYSNPIPGVKINEAELRIDYPNGSRIRLFGADNADALRGHYFDGVILDEYAQISPKLFAEVIRPALSDRSGFCVFMGTPKGRNHFWDLYEAYKDDPSWFVRTFKASQTSIIDEAELEDAKRLMSGQRGAYDQEYECSFTASIQGAYYSDLLSDAQENGRICKIPVEDLPVNTFWDLGRNDTTAIWFHQMVGREHRFIDCYESSGEGLKHYAQVLKEKGYFYGEHYLPHDVEVTELTTNRSRRETLEDYGVKPIKTVSRIKDINEGIQQVRNVLPTCFFDETRCIEGLRALENYRKDYDEKRQTFRSHPLHDWSSNYADAFRQFAQGFNLASKHKWEKLKYDTSRFL